MRQHTETPETEAAKYSSLCQNVLISISLLANQIVKVFVAATWAQALCPLSYREAFFQRFTEWDVLLTENGINNRSSVFVFPHTKAEDVLSKRTPGLLSLLPVEVKRDELSTAVNCRPPGRPSSDPLICICVCIGCICVYPQYRWLRFSTRAPPFSHVCVWLCTCLSVFNRVLSRSFLTLSLCFWRRPRWLEWACPPGRTSWLCSTPRTAGTSWCACRAWCLPMRAASGSWLAPYSATSRGEWWVMGGGRGGNKCWYRLNLSTWLEKITGTIFFTYHCAGGWTRCSLSWQDVNINGVLLSLVSLEN